MHAAMAGLVLVRNESRQLCMVDATVEGVGEQRAVLQVPHHLAGRGGEEQAEADEQPAYSEEGGALRLGRPLGERRRGQRGELPRR